MEAQKKDLIDALKASVRELQRGIDRHCSLVTSILEGQVDECDVRLLSSLCPRRPRELRMEQALIEAIGALEESRKAFKSKQLEALRIKLTHVLIEFDPS